MKIFKQLLSVGALLTASIVPSQGAVITVLNSGFEAPAQIDGGFTTTAPTSWSLTGGGGVYNSINGNYPGTTGDVGGVPSNMPGTADGVQLAYLSNSSSVLSQSLSDFLVANASYTLTLAIGNNVSGGSNNLGTFSLWAGGTMLQSVQVNSEVSVSIGSFSDFSFTYVAPGSGAIIGQTLEIRIANNDSQQYNIDNVRLTTTAVPEPSTVALLGLGLVAVLGLRRGRASL